MIKCNITLETRNELTIEQAFDELQKLKELGLADEDSKIQHKDIIILAGIYTPEQKELFLQVYDILCDNIDETYFDRIVVFLNFISGKVTEEQLNKLYENAKKIITRNFRRDSMDMSYLNTSLDNKSAKILEEVKANCIKGKAY